MNERSGNKLFENESQKLKRKLLKDERSKPRRKRKKKSKKRKRNNNDSRNSKRSELIMKNCSKNGLKK